MGSMIAIEDQSYIVSGLDSWRVWPSDEIFEPRLQRWLGVERFQLPPADEPSSGDGIRTRRFPEWYSCGDCGSLREFRDFDSSTGTAKCDTCEKTLTPSRFVIACENGHLDDFPYFAWLHKKNAAGSADTSGGHRLSLESSGQTASLRSIVIKCSCGVRPASLEGAFDKGAMPDLGIKCRAKRPWLGRGAAETSCDAAPRTLQRGASAAWFGITRSALAIPPWSETLQQRLNRAYPALRRRVERGDREEDLLEDIEADSTLTDNGRFTPEAILAAVRRRMELLDSAPLPDPDETLIFESASTLRREEYAQLYDGTGTVSREENFECVRAGDDLIPLPFGIKRSMLVKRLREVRALESFTRVTMPDPVGGDTRRAAMAGTPPKWLPAIEVSGEGVFLAVDEERLQTWERREGPRDRARQIRLRHTANLRERAEKARPSKPTGEITSPVTPRYVFLHTLAHVLINEWSLDCGYPAAALRERLYVDKDMAGILIYTATSDSAGSLGGVVAQGEHRALHTSLEAALARTEWCSQDPPCMEAEAAGIDSLNLAACYACVLLPETSCETNNVFLDRAMLIGTPDDPLTGFFNEAH
ncbi:DUF1998 domain-containing protein [Herbidospora galbida]|uniref:DUF1998 domain-containing protein n=1 Tax=Herbidospora galbida TaxID=2575442 RepID=A0A4U3M9X1_9ACTN|nr:DUF1998 domain-containing protein [Herbidospora galbida]